MTVHYILANEISKPRSVEVSNFDFLYLDVAAERVSLALRKDICRLFNMSETMADYLELAIQIMEKTALNRTSLPDKEILISLMLTEIEDEARKMD